MLILPIEEELAEFEVKSKKGYLKGKVIAIGKSVDEVSVDETVLYERINTDVTDGTTTYHLVKEVNLVSAIDE